eukprot:CAMPEP_0194135670 /NCGR_PEP_ID=MMETSP0152-20130528/5763_1 /TAXON_ID=1049557 /ORGANISM="Thalassiothrix antarctica, Strain L6-D1" /LENGTH=371 /DNA_ID=CAMNT_0038832009 /DNA_START=110 /DNA_END=1225 /DNA_ORIENTATION=-
MYSDLLDVLGNQSSSSVSTRRGEAEKHVAVSFKAGKMKMELQENGKYWVTPDKRRGQVQLVWSNDQELKWEWMDRREKDVTDSYKVVGGNKFERVDTGKEEERIYLLTNNNNSDSLKKWEMYWMQDLVNEGEDELIAKVNQYLTNPEDAAPDDDENATGSGGAEGSSSNDAGGSNVSNNAQVDALSNILENLGMPEANRTASSSESTTAGALGGGTLTLADLQGAMAGLQTGGRGRRVAAVPPTPLSEIVTPSAITALLKDDDIKDRLIALLPSGQQSEQHLEDNLRSPQTQETLRALTQALVPDDNGSMDGYHSVIANFQLNPKDGEKALTTGNPIQAFLDCILASVKREKDEEEKKTNTEETKDDRMTE